MTYDMNDAELPRGSDLIPDGSFVKLTMHIRKGGEHGQGEADRELLKAAKTPGSDVRMLDCEFTVVTGLHVRRKLWQMFTVVGGKVDDQGVSIGWKISKGMFRAMIDSALGLDPQDMSETAKGKRMLRGLADLHGITFAAKVRIEPSSDPRYGDSNRLDRVVLPGEPEYARIMAGEPVPAQSSTRPARPAVAPAAPAWAPPPTPAIPAAAPRAWDSPATPMAVPPPSASAQAGPPWLNG
jgi:hypothetical protein